MFAAGPPGAFSTLLRLEWADLKEIDRKEQRRGCRKGKHMELYC